MTFLSGWQPIAIAAALTIPPLVALYFLKLKRASAPVSSTLLWKRAVEDLQVNAPFQRIRNNLLLWLQLLVLLLAAIALGKPMVEAAQSDEDTLIVLIDRSASMGVEERTGETRLELAKREARNAIRDMPDGSRAMVIGFGDRATIVSSFETDRDALIRQIDAIEPAETTTTLSEAMTLAEAYMQNLLIAGDEKGADIEVSTVAGPARAVILTDGRIEDAEGLSVKRLPTDRMEVVCVGERRDNVAILSMDTRRNYERPAELEVFALVRNFAPAPVTLDANLYLNGEHVDVQSIVLQAGRDADPEGKEGGQSAAAPLPGSVASVAFDEIIHEGGGVAEVRLHIEEDALHADNRAWTVVQPPRNVSVLLVSEGDVFLERALRALPIELETLTPAAYERAAEDDLVIAGRSKHDVVIFEGYSTERLPVGNYIFFGAVPGIDEASAAEVIDNEVIFNWDESHPILRYVAIDAVQVYEWVRMQFPAHADLLVEGESSPVMAFFALDGRQFLVCAFGLLTRDEITGQPMLNTDWVVKAHFPVFLFNAIQYLAGSLSPMGIRNVRPGEPVTFAVPTGTDMLGVRRPDGVDDRVPTGGFPEVNYGRTRRVGVYRADPGIPGRDRFAVNLFSAAESDVAPSKTLTLSGEQMPTASQVRRVNKPFWPWLLLSMLVVLGLEWAIYSKRVFV